MPSNASLKQKRQQQGVYKRNAERGAAKRLCPQCGRKAATSTTTGTQMNEENHKLYDLVTITKCRWCDFKEIVLYNADTREHELLYSSLKSEFEIGEKVYLLIDSSAGWQKASISPMASEIVKILKDRKGIRYRLRCEDGKLRTRTSHEMYRDLKTLS